MYIFVIMIIIMSTLFIGIIYVSLFGDHSKECIYGIEDRIFQKVYADEWDYEALMSLTKTIIKDYNDEKSLEECKSNIRSILRDRNTLKRLNAEYMYKYINLIYLIQSLDEN